MQEGETVDADLLEYLRSPFSEGNAVSTFSHIIYTVDVTADSLTHCRSTINRRVTMREHVNT